VPVTSTGTAWGARLLGLCVLAGVLVVGAGLGLTGGAPTWTWIGLGVFGAAALAATVANFGDRVRVTEEGMSYENVLTSRWGWPRARTAAWEQVSEAVDLEGRTWFVEVEGQRRWVLDQLAGHEDLRLVFMERGVPIRVTQRPRLFGRQSPGA
jgi:hypothetical protein